MEMANSTTGGVTKSVSVDVLTSSALVDSPVHLSAMPSSASTDDVERLRSVSVRLTPRHCGDTNSSKTFRDTPQSASVPGYRRYKRTLSSSSSIDVEASYRSAAGGATSRRPRRTTRRSLDVAHSMTSNAAETSPRRGDSVDYTPRVWHSPTSAAGGVHSAIVTSGSRYAVDENCADLATSGPYSVIPTRQDAAAGRLYQSAVACSLTATDDVIGSRPGHLTSGPAVAPFIRQRRATHDDIRRSRDDYCLRGRLTNGIVCDSVITSGIVAPPNGHDMIVDHILTDSPYDTLLNSVDKKMRYEPRSIAVNRLHSFPGQPSSVPDPRNSPSSVTTNFAKRRRRTFDLPPGRDSQSESRGLIASDVTELDRLDLLDHITKEELFEMWQSSERALNDQLQAACQQRTVHQPQQQQQLLQQASSTERVTVT